MIRDGAGFLTRSEAKQWGLLLGLSLLLSLIAYKLRLPAALLIGPMAAAIFVAARDGSIRMSSQPFIAAQGIIGCLIGQSIPLSMVDDVARGWPLFLLGIVGVITAASAIGYVLTRMNFLPGTTAIWGTSPGASTAMIVMSEDYGADVRLVAVMQYLRVGCVIAVAAVVARIWSPSGLQTAVNVAADPVWFPTISRALFATVAIAIGGAFLATRLKIPAGAFLLPMVVTICVHETGWVGIELPPWLLAFGYALIGWSIGLRFTRPILMHALMALPRIMVSIVSLIVLCGLMAWVLVVVGGIDPLTAYLATSPGGADSIAIIAASTNVDIRFVTAMQLSRLMVAMLISPMLSRAIAKRAIRAQTAP